MTHKQRIPLPNALSEKKDSASLTRKDAKFPLQASNPLLRSLRQSPYPLMIGTIFLPLILFFFYVVIFQMHFLRFLGLGLILWIVYLIRLYFILQNKQAQISLEVQDIHEQTNLLTDETRKELKAIESFRKKIQDFAQLKDLTEKLSLCLSVEDVTHILTDEVNSFFPDPENTVILYLVQSPFSEVGMARALKGQEPVNIKSKKGDLFDQWTLRNLQPLFIQDSKKDYRFDLDKFVGQEERILGIRSLISLPLMVGHRTSGILRIDHPKENHFTTEDLRFLTAIGDMGAVALENAQLCQRLQQLAIRDSLTQLYLRRYLLERLPEEIIRQLRQDQSLAFLMIDLDKFKDYNDRFGHMAGDIVLRTIGMVLKDFFNKPGQLVCRYGGEEFSVLLPECSKRKAFQWAEEIREIIGKQTIFLRRQKTHITVSVGLAVFPQDAQTKEELILKADQALYRAKQEGRNNVQAA